MAILFCGDPHGRFEHIRRTAEAYPSAAVVLLGDMEADRPLHEELGEIGDRLWFIHGNHDTDNNDVFERVWDGPLAGRNIHGRLVTLPDGTRLAGLGGVFRESVWHPGVSQVAKFRNPDEHARSTPRVERHRNGPPRRHWSSIYLDEVDLLKLQRADVLVTHEAPGYHLQGFDIIDRLARSMRVGVTVHGHHHDCLDSSSSWVRQGFRSYGVGLRGITLIDAGGDAEIVVEGEPD